jgi:glycerophosphoryl diester phosphodiesterase
LISSFSLEVLYQTRKLASGIPIGFLMDEWMPDWESYCDALECVSVHPNQDILSEDRISEIKATGRKVFSYTVNDAKYAKKLFALGVDAVFSDCPDKIMVVGS